ncbi:MAG: LPS-assembly protein LptD [Candidatus Rokuibacteriota bacterium]
MRPPFRGLVAVLPGLLLAGATLAHAQGRAPVAVRTAGGEVTVLADQLEQVGADNLLVASGNVEITRGRSRLIADRVELNRETGDAVALGRVIFYDGEDQLTGERIDYNLKTGTGVVYKSAAKVAPFYRLSGESMERLGDSVYRVRRGIFTTCEDDSPTWSFRFGSATADLEESIYGTNASFWVKDIPLIPFVPFFAAAIRRERQTGFLFPVFGNSSDKGYFLELPFYWAISDSQDLTLAFDAYSKRGVGFTGEYRYIISAEQRGRAKGFIIQETQRGNSTRALGGFGHVWQIGRDLVFKADVNAVSDHDVLKDYGDRLQQTQVQRVESNVFLTKSWESWNFVGNLFYYQDLTTPRSVALNQLPALGLLGVRQPVPGVPGLLYEGEVSLVEFVRDVGSNGTRFDVHPRVSLPISPGGLFTLTPFVGGRLTAYDKTVVGHTTSPGVSGPIEITSDEARLRQLVEGGADLETQLARAYPVDGTLNLSAVLHTIEPRVRYIRITGVNKQKLPIWTPAVDNIQQTSRVEYSLTNRLRAKTIAPPGTEAYRWEMLRLTVGSFYDLERERVGEVFATLIVEPNPLVKLRGELVQGVHGEGIEILTADLTLGPKFLSGSVGMRYSDVSHINFLAGGLRSELFRFLTPHVEVNWDIERDSLVELRAGLDIRFQCWAFGLEYVRRQNREDRVLFSLNLLGMGGPIRTSLGVGTQDTSGQR